MVPGIVKIPKHGGPDGQGLPYPVIEELIEIIKNGLFTEEQINQAIELCLSASTQKQWNEEYVPLLVKELKED
jgi:formylmethanofuran dehydrogenase subunit B